MGGVARGERRSDGRGRHAARRLTCLDRSVERQVNSFHPASPDGAPGKAAASVRRFRFQAGVVRSTQKERALRVSFQVPNVPLERISEGDHIPLLH